jgi:site-specific DNA-methyltransferase (adenine-specific)
MGCGRKIGPFDCCSVVCTDCLEAMKHLPDGCVDLIFTSPPYNLANSNGESTGCHGRSKLLKFKDAYSAWSDNLAPERYAEWQMSVLRECWRIRRDDGAIFYNHKPRIQGKRAILPIEYNPSLPLRQIIIWNRGGGVNFGDGHYLSNHEWIVVYADEKFSLLGRSESGASDVWTIPPETENYGHPVPFPVELPSTALLTTGKETILDPFAGSGTTLVAAKKLGRHFLGFEISSEYCEIARKRLDAIDAQPSLFAPKPEQLTLGGQE